MLSTLITEDVFHAIWFESRTFEDQDVVWLAPIISNDKLFNSNKNTWFRDICWQARMKTRLYTWSLFEKQQQQKRAALYGPDSRGLEHVQTNFRCTEHKVEMTRDWKNGRKPSKSFAKLTGSKHYLCQSRQLPASLTCELACHFGAAMLFEHYTGRWEVCWIHTTVFIFGSRSVFFFSFFFSCLFYLYISFMHLCSGFWLDGSGCLFILCFIHLVSMIYFVCCERRCCKGVVVRMPLVSLVICCLKCCGSNAACIACNLLSEVLWFECCLYRL